MGLKNINSSIKSQINGIKSDIPHLKKGLIHYYLGQGKGKTTSLIGLLIRALGHGFKPILIQFLKKHSENSNNSFYFMGEIHFLRKFLEIKQFGTGYFIEPGSNLRETDLKVTRNGFEFACNIIQSGEYDLVGLDEIVNAVSLGLIDLEELLMILKNKPEHVEIVCTGVMYYKELKHLSDYVISFNPICHPYKNQGIQARKGIEY